VTLVFPSSVINITDDGNTKLSAHDAFME
jgi:hypothetical protein